MPARTGTTIVPHGSLPSASANRHQTRSFRLIDNIAGQCVNDVKATGKHMGVIVRLNGMDRERIRVRVQFAMGAENHNDIPIR